MTSFTASGKPKRGIEARRVERRYRIVMTLFRSGQMPDFSRQ